MEKNMKHLYKSAMFTDIHFGRKNNSEQHNQDCLDFIIWFIKQVKLDPKIDHIIFLGDWFETRSAIDQHTIKFAQTACDLLNELNIPIYIIVGNHDLYNKHSRDIHSSNIFKEYNNIIIIEEPQLRKEIGEKGSVLLPFLFKYEYVKLDKYKKYNVWFGHLELNNFYITGYHKVIMEHAINPDLLKGPEFIFTGHFHKRQSYENIIYIGSPFGYDFSDIEDFDKGMCIFDHKTKNCNFINYDDGPKFIQISLSDMLQQIAKKDLILPSKVSIRCIIDLQLSYEKYIKIKQLLSDSYDLRLVNFEESINLKDALEDTTDTIELDLSDESPVLNELVLKMLENIDNEKIDNKKLIKIYKEIQNA